MVYTIKYVQYNSESWYFDHVYFQLLIMHHLVYLFIYIYHFLLLPSVIIC